MDNKNGRSKSRLIKSSDLDLDEKARGSEITSSTEKNKVSPMQNKSRIYQSIIEELPFAVLLSDNSGKILMANRKTAELFGYSTINALIKTNPDLESILPPSQQTEDAVNEVAENSDVNQPSSTVIVRDRYGISISVELNRFNLRLTSSKTGIVTVLRRTDVPVSENHENANNAVELQDYIYELEHIIYLTSHDLRTPLINIQGFSEELKLNLTDLSQLVENSGLATSDDDSISRLIREDIPESLGFILASTAKMDSLLNGLIQLTRLGSTEFNFVNVDMNKLVWDVVHLFEYKLKEDQISIKIDDLPHCKGDESQLNRVLSNLISNAIKFRKPDENSLIHVTGWRDPKHATYCIEDNGIGVDKQHQDKIFEIFRRLDPASTKGEGLGLTISKKIVEKHNGSIWMESNLSEGSKFFIRLPATGDAGGKLQPELILLLAEPDDGNASLIKKSLKRSGIVNRVIHFPDGNKVMDYFGEMDKPSKGENQDILLLMNTKLPGVDSHEILHRMKNHDIYRDIPVIMITATSDKKEIESFRKLGCDDFILKPVDNVKLLKAIQNQGLFINLMLSSNKQSNREK